MENSKYKDSLFVSMFGKSVNSKEYFLSLYNAIHNTNLKIGEVTIEPFMLENVIYTGVYNDVSMIIDGKIVVLAEHQSKVNNNMPLRCLHYFVELLNRKNVTMDKHKYNKETIPLMNPEFYVFYNGDEEYPEQTELKLSDAFIKTSYSGETSLELTVKVYNINLGKNKDLFEKCKALNAYSSFVAFAKEGKQNGIENYLTYALDKCKKTSALSNYFENYSREDSMFLIGEYDREMDVAVQREEAFAEGQNKGLEAGRNEKALEDALLLIKKYNATPEQAAKDFGVSLEKLKEALL